MRTLRTLFFIALITLPAMAFAQGDNKFVPLTTLPGIKDFVGATSLPNLLGSIYKICIGVAATVAVLQIMRAGVLYMGGDSITEKKEARSLIAMSIVGLVLVLSPTIVFSIINPDILKLDISHELNGLTPDASLLGNPATDSVSQQATGDGSCSTSCAAGTTCQAGKCVAVQASGSCSTIANGATITQEQFGCCTQQPGYTVQSTAAAGSNGGLPITVYKCVQSQQPVTYGWRASLTKQDGSGRTTQQQGPFSSAQQCSDSYTSFTTKNGLVSDGTFQCDCTKPLQQQTGCNF